MANKLIKKIGFWYWQVIIVIIFIIFAQCLSHNSLHSFEYNWFITFGGRKININYYFFEWVIVPSMLVISINVIYHFFIQRINRGFNCYCNSTKYILIEGLKYLGICGLVLILGMAWLGTSFIAHPMNLLITVMVVTLTLYRLLNNEHWLLWGGTLMLFAVTGLFLIFNNELPGPMMWSIADNPIDIPKQWFNNYRLFWWGIIINRTFQYAGCIVFCFLTIFKFIKYLMGHGSKSKSVVEVKIK